MTAVSAPAASSSGLLLVANKGDHTLTIVDPVAGRAIGSVEESGVTGHEVIASPDGRRLGFQRQNSPLGEPAGGTAVFVVDVDGRHLHRITPYALDAGDHPDWSEYRRAMEWLTAQGAEAIILGCTEISLLVDQQDADVPLFDTTAIHARSAAEEAVSG